MNNITFNNNSCLGLDIILTVVFIILKLCNVISWSWLWVLSPLWISLILTVIIILYIIYNFRL